MESKICSKCKSETELSLFSKDKFKKDGLSTQCKACVKDYQQANKDKLKKYKKEYSRRHYQENKTRINLKNRKYRLDNAEKQRAYQKKYKQENKSRKNEYVKHGKEIDPNYKLLATLRARVHRALKETYKVSSTVELLGVSIKEVRVHIESQFIGGMSWKNHGAWHIDHVRPCASFDLSDPAQQRACFHYTNLQPLWARDNLLKGTNFSLKDTSTSVLEESVFLPQSTSE